MTEIDFFLMCSLHTNGYFLLPELGFVRQKEVNVLLYALKY